MHTAHSYPPQKNSAISNSPIPSPSPKKNTKKYHFLWIFAKKVVHLQRYLISITIRKYIGGQNHGTPNQRNTDTSGSRSAGF